MADGVFNISKGAFAEKVRDANTNIQVLLLKAAEADATLVDYDTVANLLAAAGNTEADFTNYARVTGITGTVTVDNVNDWVDVDIPDQTWASAGGATNNTLVKLVVSYQEGADDTTLIPMTHHDFAVTTDGSDITAQINASGIARAS